MQDLGAEFLKRLAAGEHDDVKLFDTRLHDRLSQVASSRFFSPVGEDPDLYKIADDGLHLALALWLVEALDKEERNDRDPFAPLEALLEPVTALDMTAEVVASAIEIACLRDPCPTKVASALIRHYIGLQNPPEARREAIEALIRKAPEAFVLAVRDAVLSSAHSANEGWLSAAVLAARDDAGVLTAVTRHASEWLSYYSLAPERLMFTSPGNDTVEKVEAERKKATDRLEKKLQDLTEQERQYIEGSLVRFEAGDLVGLHQQALFLLAGLPLASLAPALFAWAFGNALNSAIHSPDREFEQLVRFNKEDWKPTYCALHAILDSFLEPRSRVGEWARVTILRATGDVADAESAEALADYLTRDRKKFEGFRLVEKYCATDPCDPSSVRPDNIDATADKYRSTPVETLHLFMGRSAEDHFLEMAMPGVARFEPEAGVETLRRLATNALTREDVGRRQAILSLLPASVLLERAVVDSLIEAALKSTADPDAKNTSIRDDWLIANILFSLPCPT